MAGMSKREMMMYLLIQGEDNASDDLARVERSIRKTETAAHRASLKMFGYSNAFQEVGRVLTRYGVIALGAGVITGKLAVDFDKAMRKVNTQAHLNDKAFEQLGNSVLDISKKYGVATDQLAEGLYDIFSSIDVGQKRAQIMLRQFSKAAVAGVTDINSVSESAIGLLNAFGLGANKLNKVLDIQFRLVEKGVGDYTEFAAVLGTVSPSAVAAGQSIETMAGALAFATRNGLSASEAGTAVARAMDLITRPEIGKNLKAALGIDVIDEATGKFKQINDIITEMATTGGLAKLSEPARKKVLTDIFGQGEIRAMRFFNLAIPRFEALNNIMDDTAESGGATSRAFDTMADSISHKWDVFVQTAKAFGIQLGQSFFPALQGILNGLMGITKWFGELDKSTRNSIARFIILSGLFSLVAGLVMSFAARVMGLISIMRLAGITFAGFTTIVGGSFTAIAFGIGILASFITSFGKAGTSMKDFGMKAALIGSIIVALVATLAKLYVAVKEFAIFQWAQGLIVSFGRSLYVFATSILHGQVMTALAAINPVAVAATAAIALITYGFMDLQKQAQETEAAIESNKQALLDGTLTYQGATAFLESYTKAAEGNKWATMFAADAQEHFAEAVDRARAAIWEEVGALEQSYGAIGEHWRALIKAKIAAHDYAGAMKIVKDLNEAATGATRDLGASLSELASQGKVTADQLERTWNKQLKAVQNYDKNLTKLIKMGLPAEFAAQLQDMGMQGAGIVDALASTNKKRFQEMMTTWLRTSGGLDKVYDKLVRVNNGVVSIPTRRQIDIIVNNALAMQKLEDTWYAAVKLNTTVSMSIEVNYLRNRYGAAGGILGLAAGGITQAATAIVGEGAYHTFAGKGAEAIIPLNARGIGVLGRAMAIAFNSMQSRQNSISPPNRGGDVYHIYAPKQDAKVLVEELDWKRRTRGW